jgi:large subunit ribosomal protein L2
MGKRIRAQRKGKRKIFVKAKGKPSYRSGKAHVIDIIHDPARTAPLAKVRFQDGDVRLILAPDGIKVGDEIKVGISKEISVGNVLSLAEIPEGVPIHNIEARPGAGGQFVRASGTFAIIKRHDIGKAVVQLPSKKEKILNPRCLATIGTVAGGGRVDKPFVKAGKRWYAMRTRGKIYPITSGVAMNAIDHPFGGRTKPGIPMTVSRHAPPGAKGGSFGARRTGRRKRK